MHKVSNGNSLIHIPIFMSFGILVLGRRYRGDVDHLRYHYGEVGRNKIYDFLINPPCA